MLSNVLSTQLKIHVRWRGDGRTGLAGRGKLGRWGPNQAARSIVTRRHPKSGALEMVAVRRKDTSEWSIPGGMVNAAGSGGRDSEAALFAVLEREFSEDAAADGVDPKQFRERVDAMFEPSNGREVFRG